MIQSQKPSPKAKYPILKNKSLWFWMLSIVFLISIIVYFSSYTFEAQTQKNMEQKLNSAQKEILELRHQLEEKQHSTKSPSFQGYEQLSNKISDNFQKIFLFNKLERRVLTGKNFSEVFEQLDRLIGPSLQHPQFNILRNNTQGITPPVGIETSFRAYVPAHKKEVGALSEKIFYFFNSFLKIRTFQEKSKIEALGDLIRNDHTKKALDFIDKNLPEYKEWSISLRDRLEAKEALRALEKLVFDSLRI